MCWTFLWSVSFPGNYLPPLAPHVGVGVRAEGDVYVMYVDVAWYVLQKLSTLSGVVTLRHEVWSSSLCEHFFLALCSFFLPLVEMPFFSFSHPWIRMANAADRSMIHETPTVFQYYQENEVVLLLRRPLSCNPFLLPVIA